jgi:elongation factor Ts
MSIATIDNIKQLRAKLDAPYQDCVKALEANQNDIEQAAQWLKDKGKGANRDATTECGTIGHYTDELGTTMVIVKCETDFVAINKDFIKLADQLAENLHNENPDAVDKFKESAWTFKEAINIGADFNEYIGDGTSVASYVHHNRSRAAMVRYTGNNDAAARKIAMQVCAMKPSCVGVDDVDPIQYSQLMDKARQEARDAGKPDAIIDKIAEGKVKSILKEFVLLEQPVFDDAKSSVGQFADKNGIRVVSFVYVTL